MFYPSLISQQYSNLSKFTLKMSFEPLESYLRRTWKTRPLELLCSSGRQPVSVIVRLLLFNKTTPLYVKCSAAEEKAGHQYPPCTFPINLHNYSPVLTIFHPFVSNSLPLGCVATLKPGINKVGLRELACTEHNISLSFCICSIKMYCYVHFED